MEVLPTSSSPSHGVAQTESQRATVGLVELSYPGVAVAHDVTFEEIWPLFIDSGFLYPEKVARLQTVMPEIQQTVRALLRSNGDLLSTVVLRTDGVMDAHISVLRPYEQTWMVQHLAALPLTARKFDASARVTLALTYYTRLRSDVRWIKMFYRPNNPWPSRVFGGYAERIKDSTSSDLRVFHYLAALMNGSQRASPSQIRVRAAEEHHLPLIGEWFSSRERTVELMANDLQPDRSRLDSLSRQFRNMGLDRRREPIVAERNGRITGFALLEISSLGLNFSELTNAFTVHLLEEDPETRLALIRTAKQRYAELGRSQCIALEEGDDLSAFEAEGFTKVKDYTCWTFHRDHTEGLEEYFITLFGSRRRGA
jgi:hypothetical protein